MQRLSWARLVLACVVPSACQPPQNTASTPHDDAKPSSVASSVAAPSVTAKPPLAGGVLADAGLLDDAGATASTIARSDVAAANPCPADMVLVTGKYCPKPKQECLRWMDPPGPYRDYRCAEYKEPAVCTVDREDRRFCIDREEYVAPGETLPLANQSWTTAGKVCEAQGKRLCLESEWQFACEGEEMRPYPYGFVRDATACNTDITQNLGRTGRLVDHRAPGGAFGRCKSPFGVYDLSGNLEEWVEADNRFQKGAREVMKGSWWIPSRHACRSFQIGHGSEYGGGETGIRCCRGAE